MPSAELRELIGLLQKKGLSRGTSETVALELTEHDALGTHAQIELGINPDDLVSPWHAALAKCGNSSIQSRDFLALAVDAPSKITPHASREPTSPGIGCSILFFTVARCYDATPTRPDRGRHQCNLDTRLALGLRPRRRPVVAWASDAERCEKTPYI